MPSNAALAIGFVVAAFLASALVLFAVQGDSNEDGLLIAVFAPGSEERTIIEAVVEADGTLVRASFPNWIIIAHSGRAGFSERLKESGALLTYSRSPFGRELGGCLALALTPTVPADIRIGIENR